MTFDEGEPVEYVGVTMGSGAAFVNEMTLSPASTITCLDDCPPTGFPTADPTNQPTTAPITPRPTARPTPAPTLTPTASPTRSPTGAPTGSPTARPAAPTVPVHAQCTTHAGCSVGTFCTGLYQCLRCPNCREVGRFPGSRSLTGLAPCAARCIAATTTRTTPAFTRGDAGPGSSAGSGSGGDNDGDDDDGTATAIAIIAGLFVIAVILIGVGASGRGVCAKGEGGAAVAAVASFSNPAYDTHQGATPTVRAQALSGYMDIPPARGSTGVYLDVDAEEV